MLSLLSPTYYESMMFPMLFERTFAPPIEIEQTPDAYVLSMEIPGVEEKNFDISIDQGVLTVSAQKKNGYFRRSMTLPPNVNDKRIEAKYKYGILTVTMPKLTEKERGVRHIKVNTGAGPSAELPAITMSKPKFSFSMPQFLRPKAKAS